MHRIELKMYFSERCSALRIQRGQIPALLNLTNPNKALRRFDAFLDGGYDDEDLIARIRATTEFGGEEFDRILEEARHRQRCNQRERELADELRARREFVPHVYVDHENRVPRPIFAVAFAGGAHVFKILALPDHILAIEDLAQRRSAVEHFLTDYITNPPERNLLRSPFGNATRMLYRETYDTYVIFDLAAMAFTGTGEGSPRPGRVVWRVK